MIKASDAHKKVDALRKQIVKQEIRTAQDEILKHIDMAEYSCSVGFKISLETKKMLEDLEYDVSYQGTNTIIKW